MQELEERLIELSEALESKDERVFDDLSDYYPKRRLSEHLEPQLVPGTAVRLKLSIPFPEFPDPNI